MTFKEWKQMGIERGWVVTRDPFTQPNPIRPPRERVTGKLDEETKRKLLGYSSSQNQQKGP